MDRQEAQECADRVVASGHMCYGCPDGAYCGVSEKFNAMHQRANEGILVTEVVDLVDNHLQPKMLTISTHDPVKYNSLMAKVYMRAAQRHIDALEAHK